MKNNAKKAQKKRKKIQKQKQKKTPQANNFLYQSF